jgi:superfamily I DNA/RNA helicase
MSFAKDDPDRFFFEALSLFWRALEDHLLDQKPPIMTYNRMFSPVRRTFPENLKLLSDRAVAALVTPDDRRISGRIAADRLLDSRQPAEIRSRGRPCTWARSTALVLALRGDDWQSIYGWRGSSPSYFMEFNKEFRRRAPPA